MLSTKKCIRPDGRES